MTERPDIIDELKSGLEGVTPGPWKVGSWGDNVFSVQGEQWFPIVRLRRNDDPANDDNPDVIDAAYIACCSPDNIAAVLAYIETVEARAKAAEAKVAELTEALGTPLAMGSEVGEGTYLLKLPFESLAALEDAGNAIRSLVAARAALAGKEEG